MSSLPETNANALDTRLLYNFVYEFNIARRHVSAYPSNHPIITSKLSKVTGFLHQLLSTRNDITLGIAKDTLLIGDSYLDKNNPVYRDVAGLFFGHGLAAVTFSQHLDSEHLLEFYRIITLKRDELEKRGGILHCLEESKVKGVQVIPIDYGAFRATDEDVIAGGNQIVLEKQSSMIWDNFVSSLLKGTLADSSMTVDTSSSTDGSLMLDPEVVSDILNNRVRLSAAKGEKVVSYEDSITEFLQKTDESERSTQKEELLERLGSFINNLSPELRKQFLSSAFSSLASHQELAGPIISKVPEKAVLDALDDLSRRNAIIPPTMLKLIGKLSGNFSTQAKSIVSPHQNLSDSQLKEKIDVIFQEENPDQFIPDNYLKALQTIIADKSIAVSDNHEIAALRDCITVNTIEEQVSHIIMEMIANPPDKDATDILQQSLQELCDYFLVIGDFKELAHIHEKMRCKSDVSNDEASRSLLETFSAPAFIDEVLNGITFWGKGKFTEISDFIDRVGEPFVEPVLDRLAEEQHISMRRFFMERLQKIGAPSKRAAIARLRDKRWYFVRNLVLLLHKLGDPSVVTYLKRLTEHPHLKVRQEVVKALIGFKDPEGDRVLIRDMDSGDNEAILHAVRLAENSHSEDVNKRLVSYLTQSGLSGFEYELKSASIHSLGVIGSPLSIPGLEQFLKSKTILRAPQLNILKLEAIRSLAKYPAAAALPVLEILAEKGQGEIRQAAEDSLQQLRGGQRVN